MKYLEEINRGMRLLNSNPDTIFVGQAIQYRGTAVTHQVRDFPEHKLLEMPVAEEFQAGFCLGLSLEGKIPVCVYPRFNFVLLACNQIINHIDKWPLMSGGKSLPKIIIKVVVGSERPLDPGYQHKGNYSEAFRGMASTLDVIDLQDPDDIFISYDKALNRQDGRSTMLIEHGDFYNEK
jgi:pyruvate/2-oxoglutarate/acetoin dehydrogenase E1 component